MSAPTSALTSSPPWLATGPHSLRMRRLVVAMAVATTLMSACFITPSIRIMAQTAHRPLFWALLPALLVPPLVAGGAVLAHVLARPVNHRRRPEPSATPALRPATTPALRPTAAAAAATGTDRVWQTALLALLVGYAALVLLAAWLPVLPSYHRSDAAPAPNPLVDYYVTAAVAATAVLPPRGRFAYVIMLAPLLLATYPPSGAGPTHIAVEEVALYLATCLGDMGVLTWLLRQADTLDEADARRRALLIDLRTEQSRSKARRLSDDFVHDHILSVLKSVPTVPATSPQLRRSAREALASLHGSPESAAKACTCAELFSALSGRLRAIGGDGVVVSSSIDRDPPVPRSVAQAFEGAAAEALRNSLAHAAGTTPERGASDGVTRTATLRSGPDGVVVTISDDGRGFDPDRTPLDRHGITGSIVARMHDVGGTARIDAAPGAGTTVTLTWTDRARRRPSRSPPTRARDAPPARRRPRPRRCPCRRAWRPQSRGSSPCACSPSAPTSFSWRCGRDPTDGPRRSSGDSAPCRLPRSSCSGHGRSSACRAGRPHGRRSSSARRIRPSCSRSMSRGGPAAPRGAPVRGRPCAAGSWRGIGSGRRGPASDSSWPPPASGPWRRAGTRP